MPLYPGPAPATSRQVTAAAPTGSMSEVVGGRSIPMSSQAALTSGTLRLGGWQMLTPGQTVTNIVITAGSTAAISPTAQWFCLVRVSDLSVLSKTVDDTTTAWGVSVNKSLALAAPYVPAAFEFVYVGVLVVAVTVPTLVGWSVNANVTAVPPISCGNSTAGLTNPASLGATAGAITAGAINHYAYTT